MSDGAEPRRTPLYEVQRLSGARFVDFHGWLLPVTYTTLTEEHHAVRTRCGIFDVSHMGEITVDGPRALEFLQYLSSNDVAKIEPGQAQYSLLLNEQGGVVDDIIIYCLASDSFLLCVNAGNSDKDWEWIKLHNQHYGCEIENCSTAFAQIALQGPHSRAVLAKILSVPLESVSPKQFPAFSFKHQAVPHLGDVELIVACTGYTGEDGFEFFVPASLGAKLWTTLLELGSEFGLVAAGLGARDTLRLEACFPLHGHELRDDVPAIYCGVAWAIDWSKENFIGKAALQALRKADAPGRAVPGAPTSVTVDSCNTESCKNAQFNTGPLKIVGVEVLEPGIVRDGARLFRDGLSPESESIGWVTSGTKPPTVNRAVGIALVQPISSALGTELFAEVRGKRLRVKVIKRPFYSRSKSEA